MLQAHGLKTGSEWDLHLPTTQFIYNVTWNTTTGVTPFAELYGFIPKGPLNIQSGASQPKTTVDNFETK